MLEKIGRKVWNREIISYVIFGVLTTIVDWLVYTGMRTASVDFRVATVASWCAAVLFAFITNKLFVFRSLQLCPSQVGKEFLSFVAARLATGILNFAGMIAMVDYAGINEYVSKAILCVLVLVLNYVFSKLFIFRKKGKAR